MTIAFSMKQTVSSKCWLQCSLLYTRMSLNILHHENNKQKLQILKDLYYQKHPTNTEQNLLRV